MRYALIKDAIVKNKIVSDITLEEFGDYAAVIDLTSFDPEPDLNEIWTGTEFIPVGLKKYWVIDGEDATEMSTEDKLAVDNALMPTVHDSMYSQMDADTSAFIYSRYSAEQQQSLSLILTLALIEGRTNQAAYVSTGVDWVNSVLEYHFGIKAELDDAATLQVLEAVTWDFTSFIATDPEVWVETAMGILD